MAQKTIVEMVDDLDGTVSDDVNTVGFGLDGVVYEIDLAEDNASRLRDALAEYIGVARRTGGRVVKRGTTLTSTARPAADRERTQTIRQWARDNGWDVAERGRIPANVTEAFEQAHAAPAPTKARRGGKSKQPAFSG